MTGYMHAMYAASLEEFGTPRELPRCGGWILERQIPGFPDHDAMGCYPLFACRDWSGLPVDLEHLKKDLITLTLVTDPFGDYDLLHLSRYFDFVKPFKEHFIINLASPREKVVSKHHRKCVRRALQKVVVERCESPLQYLDDWMRLYGVLKDRHQITGIRAFSEQSFSKQLAVPGAVLFRVVHEGVTVGANLIYLQENVAYGHLSAFDSLGYCLHAPYAVKWEAIDFLCDRVKWFDIGAAPGTINNGGDGLSRFKRGWSTETRTSYLCGRIFDHAVYERMAGARRISATNYFPVYREGEFI